MNTMALSQRIDSLKNFYTREHYLLQNLTGLSYEANFVLSLNYKVVYALIGSNCLLSSQVDQRSL